MTKGFTINLGEYIKRVSQRDSNLDAPSCQRPNDIDAINISKIEPNTNMEDKDLSANIHEIDITNIYGDFFSSSLPDLHNESIIAVPEAQGVKNIYEKKKILSPFADNTLCSIKPAPEVPPEPTITPIIKSDTITDSTLR